MKRNEKNVNYFLFNRISLEKLKKKKKSNLPLKKKFKI